MRLFRLSHAQYANEQWARLASTFRSTVWVKDTLIQIVKLVLGAEHSHISNPQQAVKVILWLKDQRLDAVRKRLLSQEGITAKGPCSKSIKFVFNSRLCCF